VSIHGELPELPDNLKGELCAECGLDIDHCECPAGFAVAECDVEAAEDEDDDDDYDYDDDYDDGEEDGESDEESDEDDDDAA
jgi:hypothetical protein